MADAVVNHALRNFPSAKMCYWYIVDERGHRGGKYLIPVAEQHDKVKLR